nr:MAG TPA: hypothetical protein [Caudoviricetes sp.]
MWWPRVEGCSGVAGRFLVGCDKDKAEAACKQTASDTPSMHGGRAAFRIGSLNNFCQLWCICTPRRGPGFVLGFSFALFYNEMVKPGPNLVQT